MTPREQEFLQRMRATFRAEAAEHLQTLAAELMALEKAPPAERAPARCETAFRTAHSLKGAARAVHAREIEAVCQALESVFSGWKQGTLTPAPASFDVLLQAVDLLTRLVADLEAPAPTTDAGRVRTLIAGIQALTTASSTTAAPAPAAPPAPPAPPLPSSSNPPHPADTGVTTVRIAVDKLDRLMQAAEELLTLKQLARRRADELRQIRSRFLEWELEWVRVQRAARSLQRTLTAPEGGAVAGATELFDFLDWSAAHLKALDSTVQAAHASARHEQHAAGKLVDTVLAGTKQLVMLPFGTIAAGLPLQARQLGRERGQEIDLVLRGAEIELDKRILDELKDPLLHLVRNAVDHGIEPAAERSRAGKPAGATLTLAVTPRDGTKVEITLVDDGRGIDPERVRAAAVKRGVIPAAEARLLTPAQATALIFQSDVTTSPIVTDISGRGLGLAIVSEKVRKLGGTVTVDSQLGRGTTFRLVLPVTLAAFQGLVVRARGRTFILPATAVERVALVPQAEIKNVENRETIALQGRALSLVHLADVLDLPADARPASAAAVFPVVVLGARDERVAFVVDAVLHDEEVLVKPLAPPLLRVRNVTGATLLATGELTPILNASDLLLSARHASRARSADADATAGESDPQARTILVAEDSITSRTLIKGILESAGYRVITAVDGVDALEKLRAGAIDLVVSDVQMPRMHGFDLTARIRAEPRSAETPVILITALASPEDREKGIAVGANAYIIKSEFDQGNLLEIIRRLA